MITVFGADWCEDTRRSLRHLRRLSVAHRYLNIDEDLAALERALALPGGGRIAAAQSIAQHKTAAGMKILWALHADKDDSMRLEVVHALGSFNPPDVVDRLTEMSRDKSPMVSGEAKRLLAERKKP